ncbi:helix-turn-helix domain-containing protein [Paenibacillus sepulcri]
MYKVMVVDDETVGRKSVSKMISELGLDVIVIAEAKHGEEALELIRINKPHIVVTDMNMPIMDGQLFLENLYKHYNEIKTIVMSGYSQFEYLKAALTYQACEYVLKPISVADLRDAMVKAIEASRNYSSLQQQKKSTQDIVKLRREEFLQHVAGGRITNLSDIRKQADELQISRTAGSYRLAICMFRQFNEISATKFHGNADLFMFSVENILNEVIAGAMQGSPPLVYKSDDRMRICLILPEQVFDDNRSRELVAAFHHAVHSILKADVAAGISSVYRELDKLPEAFREAKDELFRNRLNYSGLSISSAADPARTTNGELLSSFDLKTLHQAFAAGKAAESSRLLQVFLRKAAADPAITIQGIHRDLHKILDIAASELKGIGAAHPSLFDPRAIAVILDAEQLRLFLDQLAEALGHYGASLGVSESVHTIREVVQFMDEHYFEDVSLIDVATRFHMDPSYLSKLFKTVTNENFIEYLTRKRMEKACELLGGSDRKINEIAELTGYENQRYFSQVFKKFTGRTPSEYREHHAPGT